MDTKKQGKWYFNGWSLIASFFCVGPLMLPLVWKNPRFSKKSKIVISIVIIILTYVLIEFFIKSLKSIDNYYQLLSR
ncbi:MAG: hypothetical protein Q7J37_02450 [Candidatus Omnitrophota bacterium]|nr:hypothetical protein [Candidatus Omnitrophota bacterium]